MTVETESALQTVETERERSAHQVEKNSCSVYKRRRRPTRDAKSAHHSNQAKGKITNVVEAPPAPIILSSATGISSNKRRA